jgi:Fur family transcriptional regulator, stress-responsive regulator
MPSSPAALLREAGLRVTGPRLAVLETLGRVPHADASTILAATREHAAGVSVQGVYDVLAALSEAGVLRRIQPAQSVARFEIDSGDNHHHVVCRGCEAIVDVPCSTGEPPCLDTGPAQAAGFAVEEAEVLFWGQCPSCQQMTGADRGPADPTTPEKNTKEQA